MSEIMTVINLPKGEGPNWCGLMDWGRLTREQMIAQARKNAKLDAEIAQKILDAKDEDFIVKIVRGSIVQHLVEDLKP